VSQGMSLLVYPVKDIAKAAACMQMAQFHASRQTDTVHVVELTPGA
jgi:hypothetical protein